MNELKTEKRVKRASPEIPTFLTFGRPDVGEAEIEAVSEVIRSGWLSTGPVCRKLEEEFAAYMGQGHAVCVNSATMGLMLSLAVANIGDNSEIITSPLTFAATINACLAMRVKPRFVDVDEHGLLNPDILENMRTVQETKVKGVIPVHYAGASCDMQRIMNWAAIHQYKVIEDAAHAFGGDYVGPMQGNIPGRRQKVGTIGDFTVFSFYSTKNITCGEGGLVMTKRGEWAERLRALTNQGLSASSWNRYGSGPITNYEVIHSGYKGNLSDLAASIALTQLRRWPEIQLKRAAVWRVYEDAFGFKEPGHSQHLFTIRVKNRDFLRRKLHEAGIGTGIHFRPLHLEPGYHFLGYKRGDFPVAEKIGDETLSLPISSMMSVGDAQRVVEVTKRLLEGETNA